MINFKKYSLLLAIATLVLFMVSCTHSQPDTVMKYEISPENYEKLVQIFKEYDDSSWEDDINEILISQVIPRPLEQKEKEYSERIKDICKELWIESGEAKDYFNESYSIDDYFTNINIILVPTVSFEEDLSTHALSSYDGSLVLLLGRSSPDTLDMQKWVTSAIHEICGHAVIKNHDEGIAVFFEEMLSGISRDEPKIVDGQAVNVQNISYEGLSFVYEKLANKIGKPEFYELIKQGYIPEDTLQKVFQSEISWMTFENFKKLCYIDAMFQKEPEMSYLYLEKLYNEPKEELLKHDARNTFRGLLGMSFYVLTNENPNNDYILELFGNSPTNSASIIIDKAIQAFDEFMENEIIEFYEKPFIWSDSNIITNKDFR